MRIKIVNSVIILTILCSFKLLAIKSEENTTNTNENHHVFLKKITELKEVMKQLEKEVDSLQNG